MMPPASVSARILAHPAARYFSTGRVGRDQVEDYALRKGVTPDDAARLIGPTAGH